MSPAPVPNRITIDFRDAVRPSRTWILDVDDQAPERVDLISFDAPREAPVRRPATPRPPAVRRAASRPRPAALVAECSCPEFCERDHANE